MRIQSIVPESMQRGAQVLDAILQGHSEVHPGSFAPVWETASGARYCVSDRDIDQAGLNRVVAAVEAQAISGDYEWLMEEDRELALEVLATTTILTEIPEELPAGLTIFAGDLFSGVGVRPVVDD